jgi:AcrR family transcriptional regulator
MLGRMAAKTSKVRLDRDRIVAAGLELAETPGIGTIAVRDLGASLGTDPTAIYRHFRSKEELMTALLDEVIARSVAEVEAPPEDWSTRLRQLAETTLHWFRRYPAVGAEAVVLTTHGPGELSAIELMLDAFTTAGLADDDLVQHYALMAGHILSGAAGIAREAAERGLHPAGDSPWLEGPLLVDPRAHPQVARHAARLSALQDDEVFLLGVDVIIDSARRVAG